MNSLAPPTGSGANAPLSKDNKPIFKKWWVWLIVGSVVFYAVMPKISESGSTISTPITNSTQATIAPTTTTTILEKAWNEILNAGIDPVELSKTTCKALKAVIKEQTKIMKNRDNVTAKPSKDAYDSHDFLATIEWQFFEHETNAIFKENGATDPLLAASAVETPTVNQNSLFLNDSIATCQLVESSDALITLARGIDARLIGMTAMAKNLPWYPKGFEEYKPGFAFKVLKGGLNCYSCRGLRFEVISKTSCPNTLYVEANHINSSGTVDDWSNDTVQSLSAGQRAIIEFNFYGTTSGTIRITKVNCY